MGKRENILRNEKEVSQVVLGALKITKVLRELVISHTAQPQTWEESETLILGSSYPREMVHLDRRACPARSH